MEKINSLKKMLDSGLISQEDFDCKKADILSKM
ncbi:MAG: SHOCT domain-containing protein [Ruminococcus sp.]|nr:SHOCT domain-containing protein [Ruminococcus sp.]